MIILILSLIVIGLAIFQGVLYKKKNKESGKLRLIISLLIVGILFLISYYITDTAIGIFYVFSTFIVLLSINIVNFKSNREWIRILANVIGLPLVGYLLLKSIQNMLMAPSYFISLLIAINSILNFSSKRKWTAKENISLAVGIVLTIGLLFTYYKLSGSENRVMRKQELVAQEYLEDELGIDAVEVYIPRSRGSLRGEEISVRAWDSSEKLIILTYKNNMITKHEIKDN